MFAQEEPNLFKALFMSQTMTQATLARMLADRDIEGLLKEISVNAQITLPEARRVYQKMWLLSHGIASILATNNDSFALEEARDILLDAYRGFILSIKCGG